MLLLVLYIFCIVISIKTVCMKHKYVQSSLFLNQAKGVNVVYDDYSIHIKLCFTVLEKKERIKTKILQQCKKPERCVYVYPVFYNPVYCSSLFHAAFHFQQLCNTTDYIQFIYLFCLVFSQREFILRSMSGCFGRICLLYQRQRRIK